MMKRRKMEVLYTCTGDAKWKGGRSRNMAEDTRCCMQEETVGVIVLVSS